jgi:hypothetical protein
MWKIHILRRSWPYEAAIICECAYTWGTCMVYRKHAWFIRRKHVWFVHRKHACFGLSNHQRKYASKCKQYKAFTSCTHSSMYHAQNVLWCRSTQSLNHSHMLCCIVRVKRETAFMQLQNDARHTPHVTWVAPVQTKHHLLRVISLCTYIHACMHKD